MRSCPLRRRCPSGCRPGESKGANMQLPLTGGCVCGAVRYTVATAPLDIYACHCTDFQRITSSAFSIGVVVSDAGFQATGKEARSVPGGIAESGRVKYRWVCPDCGVWLFGNPRPGTKHHGMVRVVRGGTLDDTSWVKPTTHYWTRSAQSWVGLEGMQYETQPDIAAQVHRDVGTAT
jgi:hypothetical protein